MADNVNVVDAQGNVGNVAPEDLQSVLADKSYRIASPDEVQKAAFAEDHSGALPAVGLGALSGATFGLGNEALNKLGLTTPEAQAAYRTAHPHLFTASQVGGSLLPIAGIEALTGGAATPELAAVEGADLLPAAGEIAEPLAARAAAEAPGAVSAGAEASAAQEVAGARQAAQGIVGEQQAATKAAATPGLLGHLAKDFGIGAGLGAGDQITEDALGDNTALNSEILVPAVLRGGAMASLAGLGIGVGIKALTPALRTATDAVDGVASKLSDFLAGKAVKQAVEEGSDAADAQMAMANPIEATDPKALVAEKALQKANKQDLGKDLYQQASKLLDASIDSSKEFHSDIRPDAAVNILANHDVESVRGAAQDLLSRQQSTIATLEAMRDADGRALVNSTTLGAAKTALTKAADAVGKADQPGDIFNAMNDYKRVQAKLGQFNKMAMGTNQEETINGMRLLADNATKHLEDSEVYGDMAGVQQRINAVETKKITAQRQFLKDFGRVEETSAGRRIRVPDEDKFKTALGQWAIGKRTATLKHFENLVDAVKDQTDTYADVLAKHVPGKNMDLAPGDVKQLLDAAIEAKQSGLEQAGLIARKAPVGPATAYQSIGGHIGSPAEYDKGILGAAEGGMLAMGAHALGVPAPLIGAAAVARGAIGLMRNGLKLPPAQTVKVLAMIAKAKNAWGDASDTAISNLLKHGGKVQALAPIIGEHLSRGPQDYQLGTTSHAGLSDAESYRQHSQDIQAAQGTPPPANNPLLSGAPLIGSQALAAHQNALQVLHSALPPGSAIQEHEQQATPFDRPAPVSPIDRQDFVNAANIVHEPLSVMALVQSGLVTSKTVATMKSAYPAMYQDLSQRLLTELAKMPAKDRARLSPGLVDSMSTFLGQPLSKLQAPSTMLLAQSAGATQAQPMPPGGMAPKRNRKMNSKAGARAQTPNQAADAVLQG